MSISTEDRLKELKEQRYRDLSKDNNLFNGTPHRLDVEIDKLQDQLNAEIRESRKSSRDVVRLEAQNTWRDVAELIVDAIHEHTGRFDDSDYQLIVALPNNTAVRIEQYSLGSVSVFPGEYNESTLNLDRSLGSQNGTLIVLEDVCGDRPKAVKHARLSIMRAQSR